MWPQKTKKSLLLKMVSATLFLCVGVLAMLIAQNTSVFAKLMFAGLVFGWVGDFCLHVSSKLKFFVLGLLSFLFGHVSYICGYIWATKRLFPDKSVISPYAVAALALLFGAAVLFARKRKMHFGKRLVPVIIYALTLMSMFVTAAALGLRIASSPMPYAVLGGAVLAGGALCFFVSDSLWATVNFTRLKKNRALKNANIITYFVAQLLLACTILLIRP